MTKTPGDNPKGITPETVREMRDYVVGYGQPPQATRFQKGASGNPRGRPRKTSAQPKAIAVPNAIAQQAASIARRQLKVREGGKVRTMDSVEAILLQLQRLALTGNVPAMRLLLENVREGEWAEQQRLAQEAAVTAEERAKICAYWQAKVQESAHHHANAERMGLPTPAVYPHPDDIRFGEDDRVEILGPVDATTARVYDDLAARQAFWIAYVIYDQWLRDRRKASHPGCVTNGWVSVPALLLFTDRAQLPTRMQLSDADIEERLHAGRRLTGRDRYNRLLALGVEYNCPVPPRAQRMPISVPRKAVELCISKRLPLHVLLEQMGVCFARLGSAG